MTRRICASFIFQRLLPRPGSAGVTLAPCGKGWMLTFPSPFLLAWHPAGHLRVQGDPGTDSPGVGQPGRGPFPCWSHRVRGCGPQRKSWMGASQSGNSSAASPEGWGSGGRQDTPFSALPPKLSPRNRLSALTPSQFLALSPPPCRLCFYSAAPAVAAGPGIGLPCLPRSLPPLSPSHTPAAGSLGPR